MEWKKLLYGCVGLFAACALAGCGKEEEENLQYLNLSDIACTFTGEDNLPFTVTVYAYADWTAESDASWAKVGDKTAESFTITVDDNPDSAERSARISLTAGALSREITVFQMASGKGCVRFRRLDDFQNLGAMSPNGRYVGGYTAEIPSGNTWYYTPVIIDTETGERQALGGPYKEAEICWFHGTFAVSDNGEVFYQDSNTSGTMIFDLTGGHYAPEAPGGVSRVPSVQATSLGGKYWVGYVRNDSDRLYHPIKWTDGVPEWLPMPEKDFRGYDFTTGVMARGVSADGGVIYGTTWERDDSGMVYWKDGEVKYVGHDVHTITPCQLYDGNWELFDWNLANGVTCTAERTNISPSGKWIAGAYKTEEERNHQIVETGDYPAFYNTETEKTTIFEDYNGYYAATVTDDGLGVIQSRYGTEGYVVDVEAKCAVGSVSQWVYDTYGIVIPNDCGIIAFSPDLTHIWGVGQRGYALGGVIPYVWYIAPPLGE